MIAPIYKMGYVTKEVERAMGEAWARLAKKEGHRPNGSSEKESVSPEMQKRVIEIIKRDGQTCSTAICAELGECKYTIGYYLGKMAETGVLTRRKPWQSDKARYAQWIYELPEGPKK